MKNNITCNCILKYDIKASFRKFTKTLNQFFNSSRKRANDSLQICIPVLFEQLNESKEFQGELRYTKFYFHWIMFWSMDNYLKNAKYCLRWRLHYVIIEYLYDCYPHWNSYSKSFIFNSCTLLIFPALEMKRLVLVGKILWRFDTLLYIWLIYLLFH